MSDLIDRQAAIDALEREKTYSRACNEGYIQTDPFEQYNMGLIDGIKALKRLPSAQPDLDEWCTDCKEYDAERHCCPRWNRVIRQTLYDVQPERKKGKWINHRKDRGHHIADCDQCGGTLQWLDPDGRPNFCPDCGADMREEEHDEADN